MDRPLSLKEHWEKLTPFNVLAVYVQPAVDPPKNSRFPGIPADCLWALRQDNVLLQQVFASACAADNAARLISKRLNILQTVSTEPFVAVRGKAVTRAFADGARCVIGFGDHRSFYVQYEKDYLAAALVDRLKKALPSQLS